MSRFLVLLVFVLITGCSGGGGSSAPAASGDTTTTPATPTPAKPASCAPEHAPITDTSGSHSVAWTKTVCGPSQKGEVIYIGPDSASDNGETFGATRDINRGRVTFEFTNLDYTDIEWPTNDMMFMILMMGSDKERGPSDGTYIGNDGVVFPATTEVNWHILGNRFGLEGPIETRLVTQRFDGECVPETIKFCEKKMQGRDNPYIYEGAKRYKWDCFWNTGQESTHEEFGWYPGLKDGIVYCDLYDITTTTTLLNTYYTSTSGTYDKINYFRAGGNTISLMGRPDDSFAVPMIVENLRFSIMN